MNFHELLDSTFCHHLTLTLAHFVWQGLMIAVVAVPAARLLRRSPAQSRYLVHVAALFLMAACLPVTFAVVRGMAPEPVAPAPADAIESPGGLVAPAADPVVPPAGMLERPLALHSTEDELPAPEAEPIVVAQTGGFEWRTLTPYAAGAYFAGVLAMLVRLWLALQGGRRLRRRSRPIDDPGLLQIVRRQGQLLGLRFVPVVAYCERVAVPVVVGVLRPMILLPLSLGAGLTPDQLRAILTHELTHLRRYDHLVNVLQRFVEAVLFFHPAAWYVGWRINVERENCCDDLVVATGQQPCAYAESLVRVAELSLSAQTSDPPRAQAALGASDGSRSRLGQRIGRLIDGRSHEKLRLRRSWPVAFVLVAAVLVATFALMTVNAEPAGEHEAAEPAAEMLDGIRTSKATTRPATQPTRRVIVTVKKSPKIRLDAVLWRDERREEKLAEFGKFDVKMRLAGGMPSWYCDAKLDARFAVTPGQEYLVMLELVDKKGNVVASDDVELTPTGISTKPLLPIAETLKFKLIPRHPQANYADFWGYRLTVVATRIVPSATQPAGPGVIVEKTKGKCGYVGRVIDAETGKPVGKFAIRTGWTEEPAADAKGIPWYTTTWGHQGGKFSISHSLPDDRKQYVYFRILGDGYLPQLVSDKPLSRPLSYKGVVVRLKRGRSITGRVLDHTGKPVAGANVFLVSRQRRLGLVGGKPGRFTGSSGKTDKDGCFKLSGADEMTTHVVVSCKSLHAWVTRIPKADGEMSIKLPAPATVILKYDIPGATANKFRLALVTWDMPQWKDIIDSDTMDAVAHKPQMAQGAAVTLRNLTPGAYDVGRYVKARVSDLRVTKLCDRRWIELKSGETTRINFVRKTGVAIVGDIPGLAANHCDGAFISIEETTVRPGPHSNMGPTILDFLACGPDGKFRTSRIAPGRYNVTIKAHVSKDPSGPLYTGERAPGFIGSAVVIVPETGEPVHVRILMKHLVERTKAPATAAALERCWRDLATEDYVKGSRVAAALAAGGDEAAKFLTDRLIVSPADPARIEQLIVQLDSPQFKIRVKAQDDMKALDAAALPGLRGAKGDLSIEVRTVIKVLLARESVLLMRMERAIDALARLNRSQCLQVLRKLAKRDPNAPETKLAKAKLQALLTKPAKAAPTTQAAEAAKIERLIKQLGSETFAQREAAQQALVKIGPSAVASLQAATKDKDAERVVRANQALESIQRYERIPDTVSQVLLKTYMLGKRAPIASPPGMGAEEFLEDIATDGRIAELLQIAAKGSSAERSRMKEAVIAAMRKYVDELPESTGPDAPWRPSAYQAPGVFVCAYLLSSFDEQPAAMLDLLAEVMLRYQAVLADKLKGRLKDFAGSQDGLLLALACCHYLDVFAGGRAMTPALNAGQAKALKEYAAVKDKAAGRGHPAEVEQVAVFRVAAACALAGGNERVRKLHDKWLAATAPARPKGEKLKAILPKPVKPADAAAATQPETATDRAVQSVRDNAVAKAGAEIRKGLLQLAKRFPHVGKADDLRRALGKGEVETGCVSIFVTREPRSKGGRVVGSPAAAKKDRYSVLVFLRPRIPGRTIDQRDLSLIYRNLGLEGQIHAQAGDPALAKALQLLLARALAPLKKLDEQVLVTAAAKTRATHPAGGTGEPAATALGANDLPKRWAPQMHLNYCELAGLGGRRRTVRVDGRREVTLGNCAGHASIVTTLSQQRLDALAARLHEIKIWELSKLEPQPAAPGEGEIYISLGFDGARIAGFYPLPLAVKQRVLVALRKEMQSLIDAALAVAAGERKAAADLPWGKPVRGVQVRLRMDKATWNTTEVPVVKVDLRNNGKEEFYLNGFATIPCYAHVDGLTYFGGPGLPGGLSPSYTSTAIPVKLTGSRQVAGSFRQFPSSTNADKGRLELKPGKHVVRISIRMKTRGARDEEPWLEVFSNPVQITIGARAAAGAALDLDQTAKVLVKAVGGTWKKDLHNAFHASMKILRGEIRSRAGKLVVRYNVFPFGAADENRQRSLLSAYAKAHPKGVRIVGTGAQCTVIELTFEPAASARYRQALKAALRLLAPRVTLEAFRRATTRPTTQPGGSRLEFRIVPNGLGSSRLPLIPLFVGRTTQPFAAQARRDLAINGPVKVAYGDSGLKLRWIEMKHEIPRAGLVVPLIGKYKGKDYVLLCDGDRYAMLPAARGKGAWGLADAHAAKDAQGRPAVVVKFDKSGSKLFERLTGANRGNVLAMIVDGKVLSSPTIRTMMSSHAIITGAFTDRQARGLAGSLKAGMPPNKPPAAEPAEGASFGPVTERVVAYREGFPSEAVPEPGPMYLDLDTGAYVNIKILPAMVRGAGVDVYYERQADGTGMRLTTSNMQFQPLPDKTGWDSSPKHVWRALMAASPYSLTYPGRSTLAFKTGDGGFGILHILGFTKDRRGIRIRYKLVQRPKAGRSALEKALSVEKDEGIRKAAAEALKRIRAAKPTTRPATRPAGADSLVHAVKAGMPANKLPTTQPAAQPAAKPKPGFISTA